MTTDMIRRRLDDPGDAQRVLPPGLGGGEVEALSEMYGVPVERGPRDIAGRSGRGAQPTRCDHPR